jgi:uncharacterized membrane protein
VLYKDFIAGRPPTWPAAFNPNPLLAYFAGAMLVLAGTGILLRARAAIAAVLIAVLLLVFSVSRHLPHFMDDWANTWKSIALFGGALLVACTYQYYPGKDGPDFLLSGRCMYFFVATGRGSMAIFFVVCGYAHFRYADFVQGLIPSYIPFPLFWTYFTGTCLLAAGCGLLLPKTRKWAALLSGVMISAWFFLLHMPRFVADTQNAGDRMGLGESLAIAGICFCMAGISLKEKGPLNCYDRNF